MPNLDTLSTLYAAHIAHLQSRYGAALVASGFDAVVIDAGTLQPKSRFDDQDWPFRRMPAFGHWLPLVAPGSFVAVVPGRRPVLAWHQPNSFWEEPPPPERMDFADHMDVHVFSDLAQVRAKVPSGRVAVIAETAARGHELTADALLNPPELVAALDELRVFKTPYEVACLTEANVRAAAGHDAARMAFAAGGMSELQLHLRYLHATAQDDAETPYKNIVACGRHAATLHHIAYGKTDLGHQAESLLLDAGAQCLGYHADITRTWMRGTGAAADAFGALIAAMDTMQQQLCEAITLGLPYEDLHDLSHLNCGTVLKSAGIVRAGAEEAVAKDLTFAFFPHGLGHSLGLQTHDVGCAKIRPRPDNPSLRNTRLIEAGQMFTVEPGLYFIDGLLRPLRQGPYARLIDWDLVDQLAPFGGIRIEDDVFVCGGQQIHANLTRAVLPAGGGRA